MHIVVISIIGVVVVVMLVKDIELAYCIRFVCICNAAAGYCIWCVDLLLCIV